MRDRRTNVVCGLETWIEEKLKNLDELIISNKLSNNDFNIHSSLNIKTVDIKEPYGQISIFNGLE